MRMTGVCEEAAYDPASVLPPRFFCADLLGSVGCSELLLDAGLEAVLSKCPWESQASEEPVKACRWHCPSP